MANKGKDQGTIRVLAIVSMLNKRELVTTKQILRMLDLRYDITADRKTIYSDIRSIDKFIPIEVVPGCKGGYRKYDFARCEDGK